MNHTLLSWLKAQARMDTLPVRLLRSALIPPLRNYFRYFPVDTGKQTVWTYVVAHSWWLESRAEARTIFGSRMDVDARDDCGRFICYFGVWEPNLTRFIENSLAPGDTFIDVGANSGYFTLLASTLLRPSGRVVSIEAIPETFALLTNNIASNCASNVRAINAAAWDKEETLTFCTSLDKIAGTSTALPTYAASGRLEGRCEVKAHPLIALLAHDEVSATRIIKVDVEGAERQVLDGLEQILVDGRRDLEVVVEVSGDAFDEVVLFFRKHGFSPYYLQNDYSPAGYINAPVAIPRRIEALPTGEVQVDLVFSRRSGPALL